MHKIIKLFLIPLLLIDGAIADTSNVLEIPRHLPKPNSGSYLLKNFQDKNSSVIELTLDHELQSKLTAFVKNQGNHIAALIVAEVETGNIIAMVQGKNPTYWGSKEHATLHTGFPAASLFKFASTIASLETLDLNPRKATGLRGGCARVNPSGTWLKDQSPVPNFRMSLKRAFALSCNGYYAQLGIKELGMGPILHFAEKLGWRKKIPSDFQIPVSPMQVPAPSTSSIATVGKFAAGFGLVGISAVHSAWQMLAIANDGNPIPIRITKNLKPNFPPLAPIFFAENSGKITRSHETDHNKRHRSLCL